LRWFISVGGGGGLGGAAGKRQGEDSKFTVSKLEAMTVEAHLKEKGRSPKR